MKSEIPAPTESEEQRTLFRWATLQSLKHPELALMFHVPNEGKRSKVVGGRMKAEGLKSGVPDIFLPVPRGEYHGLFIEMKRIRGGAVTDCQKLWIHDLAHQGYKAVVCRGWQNAADEILKYLGEQKHEQGCADRQFNP